MLGGRLRELDSRPLEKSLQLNGLRSKRSPILPSLDPEDHIAVNVRTNRNVRLS